MRKNKFGNTIIDASLGRLSAEAMLTLQNQLDKNLAHKELFEEYSTLVKMSEAISLQPVEVGKEFTCKVMDKIKRDSQKNWINSFMEFFANLNTHIPKILVPTIFATCCVSIIIISLLSTEPNLQVPEHIVRGGNGGGSTFSEASYNDTLVHNAVGNILSLIQGAFGALVMTLSALIGITCLCFRRWKTGAFFISIAVLSFILRVSVNWLFGSNY